MTPRQALDMLADLGASPWLLRHHELVLEAAILICDRLTDVTFDRAAVLVGAALHDAGKIVQPEEMSVAGNKHEEAGRDLLCERGVSPSIARFCVTHAEWDAAACSFEDRLVALADKLWKGKRDAALENRLVDEIAVATRAEPWEVFDRFDAICEAVAADGPDRLARTNL